ncbi:MAG: Fur family transcriptional regulator [Dehalococcoidia bacterium]
MPHDEPDVARAIRASGRRLTIQRAMILRALHQLPGHSTAEQIHARVSADDRSAEMAVSTVYRTLDALADMGLVSASANSAGVTTYEWAAPGTSHHHLICDHCGRAEEVDLASLAALRAEVLREHGFAVDLRHMAMRGTCARCTERHETEQEAKR